LPLDFAPAGVCYGSATPPCKGTLPRRQKQRTVAAAELDGSKSEWFHLLKSKLTAFKSMNPMSKYRILVPSRDDILCLSRIRMGWPQALHVEEATERVFYARSDRHPTPNFFLEKKGRNNNNSMISSVRTTALSAFEAPNFKAWNTMSGMSQSVR
jgi:hypothetical protein